MFQLFGKKEKKEIDKNIYSPVEGTCISLDDVNDMVFAKRLMGEGIAFVFDGDSVCSPVDGEIIMVASTKHAIGILGSNGVEILIHVGLDTVNLNGEGFDVLVKANQNVKKGTPILKVDQDFMKEKQIDLTTPMIITNDNGLGLSFIHVNDKVSVGDIVVSVQ